jgi:hypothetical protein
MNLANMMNLTNFEMGLIAVEGTLVLIFFFLVMFIRRTLRQSADRPPVSSHSLREWAQESEKICESLSKNLEEKREIADRLVLRLDEKIQALQLLMGKADQEFPGSVRCAGKRDLHTQILEMAEEGLDLPEIARRLQISKGEVQLALDLKRYQQLPG